MSAQNTPYYLGLDIGTDSVGYAVTDTGYRPLKRKGDPLMGVTTFEAASPAQDRRAFRTARRRVDRRQQRVALVNEIFAPEIGKIDPRFFIRRKESMLFRDETEDAFILFNDKDFTDADYYKRYPTVHHLICDLMRADEPRDVRLVYLACAWLVAHRGHFLFDVPAEETAKLLNFNAVYEDFCAYFRMMGVPLPWADGITADTILGILRMNTGVSRKKEAFVANVFGGKKPKKAKDDDGIEGAFPFGREAIVALLCGGKVKPEEVYQTGAYEEVESISLKSPEEDFARVLGELGEDGELLRKLRALQDCAMLIVAQNDMETLSDAKVAVYEQHKADLAALKRFVKKYLPGSYDEIFRAASGENYTAYSYNVKSCKDKQAVKRASKDTFSDYLAKKIKGIEVEPADEAFYADMKTRLDARTFLPKQKDTDNRVVPEQLYRHELKLLLDRAQGYLPMLGEKDATGLTAKEKLLSIFDFRIPYFVGPLRKDNGSHAWIERKEEGRIYPWNFRDKVNLDASEAEFINRMTASCSYVAGATVLPVRSLLYCRFAVLNELNNLKVNGVPVPVEVKQAIFTDLLQQKPRVTRKDIQAYLLKEGHIDAKAEVTGVDVRMNATLSSYHQFKRLLTAGTLTEADVESIIEHAAYSEDKNRMLRWLQTNYPALSEADRKYITGLNLKEFGRLSAELLTGIEGADVQTGEVFTIIQALWERNVNLMQLLSDRYTFANVIEERNKDYYREHPANLNDRLDEMYISNAVKRPIIRTLEICKDVVKATGRAPEKIFVEMARDASGDQKGKRTVTRKEQLLDLYKKIKSDDARRLEKELADMGIMADNRLQSDKLFLYYLQMGRCAYSGAPISLGALMSAEYNIDHIYPQAFVKDDSILNNKVLVTSVSNGEKRDVYPIAAAVRSAMHGMWTAWKESGLITEEKYKRLTRATPFTDEERWGFINRQLVETRQSTKAVAELLQELYPDTAIVYAKAGLVSEFRQEFDMLKSRQVNNLHHAKDAYLNIVVGNVYHERFSKRWFALNSTYSVNPKTIFTHEVKAGSTVVWRGKEDIALVRGVMEKNCIHVTRYAFCRHGGLFDQQPVKAKEGLVPLKKGLDTAKYGGYNKPTATFFALVKYAVAKKTDVMFVPVDLMAAERFLADQNFAKQYAAETVQSIIGKPVLAAELLLGGRPIKVNTTLEVDGMRMMITGKSSGGTRIMFSALKPLLIGTERERYVKSLEMFALKQQTNKNILADAEHDGITGEKNIALYDVLMDKLANSSFAQCPGNQLKTMQEGRGKFVELELDRQIEFLINIIPWFNTVPGSFDFSLIGGSKNAGVRVLSSNLSNWKQYKDVRIIDASASGIFEKRSENLLELL